MEQNIKAMTELEKLLTEATSQTMIKPDQMKFKRIVEILNSRANLPKEFAKLLKNKIMSLKHPRSQIMLFEVLEFTTCKGSSPLHNEYNNKDFLQTLNSIFNQKTLTEEVRQKLLGLIQFWNFLFSAKKDLYPNFSWYYNSISNRGVQFPQAKQSSYMSAPMQQSQPSGMMSGSTQPVQTTNVSSAQKPVQPVQDDEISDTMNDKQRKLFKDLSVVLENMHMANSMMDSNEPGIDEVIGNMHKMENKLQPLPEKLLQANEGFLHAFCCAILEDMNFTMQRYQRHMNRQPTSKFNSSSEQILEQARQMVRGQNDQTENPPRMEEPAFQESNNMGFENQQNFEAQSAPQQQPEFDFSGGNNFGSQPQSNQNQFGGQFESNFSQPQQQNDPFGAQPQFGQEAFGNQSQGFQNQFSNQNPGFNQQDGFGFGQNMPNTLTFGGEMRQPLQQNSGRDQNQFDAKNDAFGGF